MKSKQVLAVLTLTKKTKNLFYKQLNNFLEDQVILKVFAVEEGIDKEINADLVVTTNLAMEVYHNYVNENCDYIIANRSVQLSSLDKLINIPAGKRALIMGSTRKSTVETKAFLEMVGINHIEMIPFFLNNKTKAEETGDLVIVTGLAKDVPDNLKVIDISKRQMGITTIIQIMKKLNLLGENIDLVINNYVKQLVELSQRLNNEVVEVNKINKILHKIINNVSDGIIYINNEQNIKIFNKIAKRTFNIKDENNIETNIENIFDFNIKDIINSKDKMLDYIREIRDGKKVIANILPVVESENNSGVLVIFKDITEIKEMEESLRKEMQKSGHIAKYEFSDIKGSSEKTSDLKNKAFNIAQSNNTVIIQGETGTGKELFAQAIHNASERKNGPFVAINCATIPDNLFESELFGYVEGAFTGASNKGKPGVFEQAHKGTIFLDEIGEIPYNIQTKLLRILEEKEVLRIGAKKIVPVDVRVVVASNKNLKKMVDNKKFREDLYYRINVLPIFIPPLRERKEDLLDLINFFLKMFNKKNLTLDRKVLSKIYNYNWPGNIRQLRNCIESISQMCDDAVNIQDLPDYLSKKNKFLNNGLDKKHLLEKLNNPGKKNEYLFILRELHLAKQIGINLGRRRIAENAKLNNIDLNSQMVRGRLKKLEKLSLVNIGKGRQGSKITKKGINFIQSL